MELRDLMVTPIVLIIVYVGAYMIRPYVTDNLTRRYFIPALSVRIIGALAVGFVYQFYYRGGDTFAFHTHGSRHIWEAIVESPADGFKIFFSNGEYGPGLWDAAEKIWFWRDNSSFVVIQVATVFDLLTFSSYSATAVLFAVIAFVGGWLLFKTFYKSFPDAHGGIALAALFIPSVAFWGSGIFKDTLTLSAVSIATYCFHSVFIERSYRFRIIFLLAFCLFIIFKVKVYILMCLLPSLFFWWFAFNFASIRSPMLRMMIAPFLLIVALLSAYMAVSRVVADDPRYNISRLSETARITAYDIRYGWGARTGEGSGYTLGNLDGSWQSMLALAPQAMTVSLFRPYLWEVKNPLMLLSAFESLAVLILTVVLIVRVRHRLFVRMFDPHILFCTTFSLIFAFAVGVSTYNFGTLSRYKIPMMPFYILIMVLLDSYLKRERKVGRLEATE